MCTITIGFVSVFVKVKEVQAKADAPAALTQGRVGGGKALRAYPAWRPLPRLLGTARAAAATSSPGNDKGRGSWPRRTTRRSRSNHCENKGAFAGWRRHRTRTTMLQTTIDAVKAILSTDPSVNEEDKKALVEALKKGPGVAAVHDRVLRRPEAARRLGVGVKALDLWKRRGVLEPVTIPGSSRALGFRESDVEALIAGKSGGVRA